MISEAILKALKDSKVTQRKCADDNGINRSNFNAFLKKKRPLPVHDIENVLRYLNLEIREKIDS